jgi:hypothetical protein
MVHHIVIVNNYELDVSYEKFKLYVREIEPGITNTKPPFPPSPFC